MGMIGRADANDPLVAEGAEEIHKLHKQVWETAVLARATHVAMNLHVTDWVAS